ncbi:20547_t:CDS:2, partial [Rhizophagus irregularis]
MSLYNMYENIPEASILEMFETEIESDESEEPAIFALDEEYLKKIVELYTEDTSETDKGDNEGSSQLARVLQTIQFNEQDSQSVLKDKNINPKRKCIELPENQENVESQPPLKRQRVVTTEEEKEILKCLLQKKIMPSENEINEVLTKLPQSWNIQCIK